MEPGVKLAMTARAQSIPPSTITAAATAPSPTPGRTSPPCVRTRGQARKRPAPQVAKRRRLRSPSRVQGAQPPPGVQRVPRNAERRPRLSPEGGCREPNAFRYRGSPPVPKSIGGWARWDNGGRHHEPPSLSVLEGRLEGPANPPLQNTNKCAIVPHEVGTRPASLSRSLPHTYCTGG